MPGSDPKPPSFRVDLTDVELKSLGLGHLIKLSVDLPSLDRFSDSARNGAAEMSEYYSRLYSLERQMRETIDSVLESKHGADWWELCVPAEIKEKARQVQQAEERSGITPRSGHPIVYTTLGELGQIVDANWKSLADVFVNQQAMRRIMRDLNQLRAFVAHCTPLPDDEVKRLDLNIKDWLRQLR